MPTNNIITQLDWNEENLDQVISDLYRDIDSDENLRQRLMTEPFEVLSSRIAIPESYRVGILVVAKGQDSMTLFLPQASTAIADLIPQCTSEENPQRNYIIKCSHLPIW